jgi:hypothetical protein
VSRTLIFLHIPKTAGITLRQVIYRQYRPDECLLLHPKGTHEDRQAYFDYLNGEGPKPPMDRGGPLRAYLQELEGLSPKHLARIRVVMGHLWFGIHEGIPGPATYFTMLREPVDRVLSMYQQRKRGLRLDRGLTLSVEEWARSERDLYMNNEQTRRLASTSAIDTRLGPCTPEMFERALRNLREHVSAVGVTERFDLSLLVMARTFGWRKLAYTPANVSGARPRAEGLDDDVLAILRRNNEYDLELHRAAGEILDEQVERLGIDPKRDVATLQGRNRVRRRARAPAAARSTLGRRPRERAPSDEIDTVGGPVVTPPTIVFLHLGKTAGSTLRGLIRRQYRWEESLVLGPGGPDLDILIRYLNGEGPAPSGNFGPAENRERIREIPPEELMRYRAVMGHLWFGVHESLPGPSTYLTMLRDPIERVLSVYQQRVTGSGPSTALTLTVEEWARSERDPNLDNEQTRRLASHPSDADATAGAATPEMFESAVRNLRERVSVVGLTERFDLSLLAMARTFGWHKLSYTRTNVSTGRPRAEDLPEDVLGILRRHNEYDMELHRIGRGLLEEQVERLGIDPRRDVAALRRRNLVYRRTRSARDLLRTRLGARSWQTGPAGPEGGRDADVSAPSPAVIFLHVPKTAGWTLRDLFDRQFRPGEVWTAPATRGEPELHYLRYVQGEEDRPGRGGPADNNRRYRRMLRDLSPEQLERIRLLIGHFWFGLHEVLPFPAEYVTMLRDPVARILSLYAHRTTHHGLKKSLPDYLREGRDWELDNGQTRRLAGSAGDEDVRFAPATPELLERAKANLRRVRVVGVTERFDEFVALLRLDLGWRPFAYAPRNVTANRPREQDLDPAILEALRSRNALDLELHRFAGELMDERTAGRRAQVEARLRAIRRRNDLYRRAAPLARHVRKRARDARARLGQLLGSRGPGS